MGTQFYDDEYEEVEFLGYTVTMPSVERIAYYRDSMNKIIKEYDDLMKCLQGQVDKMKAEGSGAWSRILTAFWGGFEDDTNGDLVEVLYNNYIDWDSASIAPDPAFSDEFGKNTKAYRELVRLRRALVREARDIQETYENNYQRGANAAFSKAASNVTGMGFGIITNSAVDLLAYNAISNATIRSQVKKADAQYTNDLGRLARSLDGAYKKALLSLMYDHYAPAARNCIAMYANEITQKTIAYEVRYNNNAVFEKISKFNPDKSQSIVDSINSNSSEDTIRKKLFEAFMECPYNESIYIKAAQTGVMDRSSFLYSGYYGYKDNIIKATKKCCSNNLEDLDYVKKHISFMIGYGETDEKILEELYMPLVSNIIKKYDGLKIWMEPQKPIKPFIVNELKIQNIASFVVMDEMSIHGKLKSYMSNIVTEKCWKTLIDNNLIVWRKVSLIENYEYTPMNEYYINILSKKIMEYHTIMSEANDRYMKADKEYTDKCNELQSSINRLESEISQIGVFGFKKKKTLREELESQKSSYYDYLKHNKPSLNWI